MSANCFQLYGSRTVEEDEEDSQLPNFHHHDSMPVNQRRVLKAAEGPPNSQRYPSQHQSSQRRQPQSQRSDNFIVSGEPDSQPYPSQVSSYQDAQDPNNFLSSSRQPTPSTPSQSSQIPVTPSQSLSTPARPITARGLTFTPQTPRGSSRQATPSQQSVVRWEPFRTIPINPIPPQLSDEPIIPDPLRPQPQFVAPYRPQSPEHFAKRSYGSKKRLPLAFQDRSPSPPQWPSLDCTPYTLPATPSIWPREGEFPRPPPREPLISVKGFIRRVEGDEGRVARWEQQGWGNHPSNLSRCAGVQGFFQVEDFPAWNW